MIAYQTACYALHVELLRILRFAFAGTVWTFESRPLAHLGHGFESNDVPTAHHHWRVVVGRLLLGDGADEYGMEMIRRW